MLNLTQLKNALAPIQNLTKAESQVTLSGVEIYVRILTPEQDYSVQKESQFILEELQEVMDGGDRVKLLAYLDEFRLQTLVRCIVQIGSLDLREVTHIETGEQLENGTPIKVSKEKALREILGEWNRPMQIAVLDCYNELVEKVEKQTGTSVKGDFSDESSEIAHLKERLQELENSQQTKKIQKEQDVRSTFRSVVETSKAKTTDEERAKDAKEFLEKEKVQKEKVQQQEQEKDGRESDASADVSTRNPIFPTQMTPPPKTVETQKPVSTPQPQNPQPPQPPQNEDSVFFQEQEFPPRPDGVKDGIEVYRLPAQTLGSEVAPPQQKRTQTTSRNPRFVAPNKQT